MTRAEEIKQAAHLYSPNNWHNTADTFEYGAKWADNTLIERAQNFFRTTHHLHKLDGIELKNFIEDFRKAVKE